MYVDVTVVHCSFMNIDNNDIVDLVKVQCSSCLELELNYPACTPNVHGDVNAFRGPFWVWGKIDDVKRAFFGERAP